VEDPAYFSASAPEPAPTPTKEPAKTKVAAQ
jgi:hypothetical protein